MISISRCCLIAACLAIAANGQDQSTEVHPCNGRTTRFASILTDCKGFWRCFQNPPTSGQCPDDTLFHDERQTCVLPRNQRCFECNRNIFHRLRSVHGACNQFSMCFNGRATLHSCQSSLWFDGRHGIQNCNRRPANGVCHREDADGDGEQAIRCPNILPRPLYFRTPDCSGYNGRHR